MEAVDFLNYYNTNYTKKTIIYLDPPYYGNNFNKLYENKINHEQLWNSINLLKNKCKLIISYNYCQKILEQFKDWNIEIINHKYSATTFAGFNKDAKELIITNE